MHSRLLSAEFVKILVRVSRSTALHTYRYNARASAHSGQRNMNTKPAKAPAKAPHTRAHAHPAPQAKHTAPLTMRCPRRRRPPGSRPRRLQSRATAQELWRRGHCQRTGAASHSRAKLSALPQTLPHYNWVYLTCVRNPEVPWFLPKIELQVAAGVWGRTVGVAECRVLGLLGAPGLDVAVGRALHALLAVEVERVVFRLGLACAGGTWLAHTRQAPLAALRCRPQLSPVLHLPCECSNRRAPRHSTGLGGQAARPKVASTATPLGMPKPLAAATAACAPWEVKGLGGQLARPGSTPVRLLSVSRGVSPEPLAARTASAARCGRAPARRTAALLEHPRVLHATLDRQSAAAGQQGTLAQADASRHLRAADQGYYCALEASSRAQTAGMPHRVSSWFTDPPDQLHRGDKNRPKAEPECRPCSLPGCPERSPLARAAGAANQASSTPHIQASHGPRPGYAPGTQCVQGLPCRGQRSHGNARTVRKLSPRAPRGNQALKHPPPQSFPQRQYQEKATHGRQVWGPTT